MNNPTLLNSLAMVRLDISIWSARAKLNRSDLQDSRALPPQAMVSLGSKKLFDPTKLRVFGALKQQAIRMLDCYGTKFLGGWATDVDKLPEIEPKLADISLKFHEAVRDFFSGYDDGINDWVAKFPAYETVLRHAVPTKTQLQKKFSFDWQTFQITPVGGDNVAHNNTKDAISNLNSDALKDVADIIAGIYERSFKDKQTVKKTAFRPFKQLTTKLHSLAFIYPYFNDLNNLLTGIIDGYSMRCNDPAFVATFSRLLESITTAKGLTKLIEPFVNGNKTQEDILDAMTVVPLQQDEPVDTPIIQDVGPLEPVDTLLDSADEILGNNTVQVQEDNLDSGGLW